MASANVVPSAKIVPIELSREEKGSNLERELTALENEFNFQPGTRDAVAEAVAQGHARVCSVLTVFLSQQQQMLEQHMAAQQQVVSTLLEAEQATLQRLQHLGDPAALPVETKQANLVSDQVSPANQVSPATEKTKESEEIPAVHEDPEHKHGGNEDDEEMLDIWRQCSGIHTVDKWVCNYKKHPAGWAALLFIHGIPEVTGRLRSKVDNYSIYSALFLSAALPLMADPPNLMTVSCNLPDNWDSWGSWECAIRKRLYFFALFVGITAHILAILLGMAFTNALNETARDSDVFRMFARGQAFKATLKSQKAFATGCVADIVALIAVVSHYLSWVEALVVALVLIAPAGRLYWQTSSLLFNNGSIVSYWRKLPDADDPYELAAPISSFMARSELNKKRFMGEHGLVVPKVSVRKNADQFAPGQSSGSNNASAVAAIF